MAVITISREFGSGGDEIATRVCDLLQYRFFDKRLMVEVAAEVGLCESEVVDFSEDRYEVRSFLTRVLRAGPRTVATVYAWEEDTSGRKTLTERQLNAAQCAELVRHTVLAAYKQGDVVILGRGGQAILRDKPGALHVRVIAPLPVRMEKLRQQGMSGIAEMKLQINEKDRATAEYVQRFHGVQWDDPDLYDLVINTARLDIESAARAIATLVEHIKAAPVG